MMIDGDFMANDKLGGLAHDPGDQFQVRPQLFLTTFDQNRVVDRRVNLHALGDQADERHAQNIGAGGLHRVVLQAPQFGIGRDMQRPAKGGVHDPVRGRGIQKIVHPLPIAGEQASVPIQQDILGVLDTNAKSISNPGCAGTVVYTKVEWFQNAVAEVLMRLLGSIRGHHAAFFGKPQVGIVAFNRLNHIRVS